MAGKYAGADYGEREIDDGGDGDDYSIETADKLRCGTELKQAEKIKVFLSFFKFPSSYHSLHSFSWRFYRKKTLYITIQRCVDGDSGDD